MTAAEVSSQEVGERADTLFRARTVTATFSLRACSEEAGYISTGSTSATQCCTSQPSRANTRPIWSACSGCPRRRRLPEPGPEIFRIRKVRIRNFRFRLSNFMEALSVYPGYGINYDDIDLTADINGHSLRFSGGRMYGVADKVTPDREIRLQAPEGQRALRRGPGQDARREFQAAGPLVEAERQVLLDDIRLARRLQ